MVDLLTQANHQSAWHSVCIAHLDVVGAGIRQEERICVAYIGPEREKGTSGGYVISCMQREGSVGEQTNGNGTMDDGGEGMRKKINDKAGCKCGQKV